MAKKTLPVRDRITQIRKIRLSDIAHNARNWHLHPDRQRQALQEVYNQVGWAGVPLVYHSEREGGLTFIDGHLRKEHSPDLVVNVAVLDLDDAEADVLLATYDPLSGLAGVDVEALAALSETVEVDLAGFWAEGELEALLGEVGDVEFPEYDESVEDEVEYIECPHCGEKWPK